VKDYQYNANARITPGLPNCLGYAHQTPIVIKNSCARVNFYEARRVIHADNSILFPENHQADLSATGRNTT